MTATTEEPRDALLIDIQFEPVGGAPHLLDKFRQIQISPECKVSDVKVALNQYFNKKLVNGNSIFIYINKAFAPALSDTIGSLYHHYALNNKLFIYYDISPCFG